MEFPVEGKHATKKIGTTNLEEGRGGEGRGGRGGAHPLALLLWIPPCMVLTVHSLALSRVIRLITVSRVSF